MTEELLARLNEYSRNLFTYPVYGLPIYDAERLIAMKKIIDNWLKENKFIKNDN